MFRVCSFGSHKTGELISQEPTPSVRDAGDPKTGIRCNEPPFPQVPEKPGCALHRVSTAPRRRGWVQTACELARTESPVVSKDHQRGTPSVNPSRFYRAFDFIGSRYFRLLNEVRHCGELGVPFLTMQFESG